MPVVHRLLRSKSLAQAVRPVIEGLEERRLLAGDPLAFANTVQTLPYVLDFTKQVNGIFDRSGQSIGFTRVQLNTGGTQYQPAALNLNTAAGELDVTTVGTSSSGSNFGTYNSQVNAVETQFDGTTSGFTVTTRLKGPLSQISAPWEGAAVYLGPDQDNYVKLNAEYDQTRGQVLEFRMEQNANTSAAPVYVGIGNFANLSTLDLRLTGDASTRNVTASYSVNGGGYVSVPGSFQVAASFFTSASRAGIETASLNSLAPIAIPFSRFEIDPGTAAVLHPSVRTTNIAPNATGVTLDTAVTADLNLPNAGLNPSTVNATNVQLWRTSDHAVVPAVVNTSGGGDSIVLQPANTLLPNTQYTFSVSAGVLDTKGVSFTPYTFNFTTGNTQTQPDPTIAFVPQDLPSAQNTAYTSVRIGPDHKLYASSEDGRIFRWTINADGTLGAPQIITSLQTANGGNRLITGFAFDPSATAANPIIWVSNSYFGFTNVPDWTGKITVMSGPDLQTVQDAVINLPRSFQDHGTEQPVFGPDGKLYVAQGSNTATGAPDTTWGNRPERQLSAAILRLDTSKLNPAAGPLNVMTTDGGGSYNPYAAGAPLTIYATGVRNAYSLVFTSDGKLYAPTNGSSAGGNTPGFPNAVNGNRIDTGLPYNGPSVPGLTNVPQTEIDWLFNIQQGGYYGHPDPVRGEYVLDAGNPTGSTDPNTVPQYPVGTQPDANYRGYAYSFGAHRSPDGVIQYQDKTFGGKLQGALLVTEYSAGSDIVAITRDANGNIVNAQRNIPGLTDLNNPVDLVEDNATGNIYVAELGGMKLVLLKPTLAHPSATVDKTLLAFSSIAPGNSGAGASQTQSLTVTNNGTTGLNLTSFNIVNDPSVATQDAGSFGLPNLGSVPTSLAPGQSAVITINFAAPSTGLHSALFQIGTNDTAHPTLTIALRGLGTTGTGGGNEPSLAAILRAYEIPTIVGDGPNDSNAFTSTFYPATPDASSQEVTMPRLMKAGPGSVTITNLAAFSVPNQPALRFGYYTPGDPTNTTQLFTFNQNDSQTMSPAAQGSTSFDPGLAASFGLYANFPTFTDNGKQRMSYSEDALNPWDASVPRKFRFFPLKNPDGSVVPNAFVFAAEDNNIPFGNIQPYDSNDIVGIIRNVKAAPAAPVVGVENLSGVPSNTRLVFNRIQNKNPNNPAGFVDIVHDQNTIKIRNTGSQPLTINSLALSDSTNWQIVNPPAPGTQVPVGSSINVTVKFVAQSNPPHSDNQTNASQTVNGIPVTQAGGVWNGTLTINSNDPVNPARVIQLAGYWQNTSENENEPGLQTLVNLVYGYGTNIATPAQPQYPNNGTAPVYYGEEVASGLWNQADPTLPVSVVQLATYHSQYDFTQTPPAPTSAGVYWYAQATPGNWNQLFRTVTGEGQSLLPYASGGSTSVPAGATFNPGGTFGWNLDGENSQNALNTTDINTFGRSGHAVRFYPARDATGHLIANTFLMVMDYEGSTFDNSDFQDNVYLVSNMRPVALPPTPASLFATAPPTGGVSLQWQPVAYSPATYNVYRATSVNGPYTKLNNSPLSQASYTDKATLPATNYFYRVAAVNSSTLLESVAADARVTTAGSITATAPAAPKNLIATPSSGGILLQWTANTEPDLSGYNVYRGTAPSGPFTLLTPSPITPNSYNDSAAPQGVTSFYEVVAVNSSAMTSPPSSTNAARPASGATATSLYAPNAAPTAAQQNVSDPTIVSRGGVELGVKFRSDVAGSITGVRFYKSSQSTGAHTGELWSSAGQLLATATFSNETASGWQQVSFSNPVNIAANTTYVVAYHATAGFITYSNGALAASGIDNAPLHALANGVDGGNSVYSYDLTPGVSNFPGTFNGQSPSYWVDVVFNSATAGTAPSAPATLTATANNPSQIGLTWAASTGTVTAYHIERSPDGVTFVEIATSATASYTDNAVQSGKTYTYRVRAENAGAFSGYSPTSQATTPQVPPGVPASLTASAPTPTQVNLTWQASTGTVTAYHIERSPDGTTFTEIGTSPTPSFTDNSVTAATPYTYRVRTEGAGIVTGYSNTAAVTTPQVQALTSADINASQPGSTTVVTPGVDYDVTAGGPAIYNTADGFRFLYLQQSGDFDVKVRVASISFAGGIDQAGLMARSSLDPSSPEVSVTASPGQGYRFKYRTSQAGATTSLTTAAATSYPNVWLRLQRVGNVLTGYFSPDGANWTSAGSIGVAFSDPLYLGLAAAANVTTSTINVQFRSFQGATSTTPVQAPSTPAGLTATANTPTQVALTWSASTGTVTAYHVERSADGVNFGEIATSAAPSYTDNSAQSGKTYTYRVRAENAGAFSGYSLTAQATTPLVPPAPPASVTPNANAPTQVGVTWAASTGTVSTYHLERSTDGVNFLEIATTPLTSFTDNAVVAGKQYTYRVRTEGAGTLSGYSPTGQTTTPQVTALTSADIGASMPGSTTTIQSGADYDVTAGGPAIYNTADGFRFLYLPQSGNFDVKVRIASISVSGGIDQAGLMVRTSLDPSSPEIAVTASPTQGYRFKYRTAQAGATTGPTTSASTPYPNVWLRLQRVGNLFTGYFSSDGVNWTAAGNLTLAMPSSLFLGLAAAANVANATINVQFRSFEQTSLPDPVTSLTAAAVDASHQKLTWTSAPGATSYLVQRKASTDPDYLDLTTNAAGTTYTDGTVQAAQAYSYRVIAVSGSGATTGLSATTTVNT
jgi:fibronectin type 3 domain-containing protein